MSNPMPILPSFYRHRAMGRAASPPTFACYEQIQYGDEEGSDDEDSQSESGSESEQEKEPGAAGAGDCSEDDDSRTYHAAVSGSTPEDEDDHTQSMDVDSPEPSPSKDKGKQRAVSPAPLIGSPTSSGSVSPSRSPAKSLIRAHRKQARAARVQVLRPILTIQRSQGFVWNQDLFVPAWSKDRYTISTSPPHPNSRSGFISTSASSTASSLLDYDKYEIEVVEIRLDEDDFSVFS